jgi:hypothetical protein
MSLVIPDGCFLHVTDERTLVVRHSDGEPILAVVDGKFVAIEVWKAGIVKSSFSVQNADGFTGFPDHDKEHPHYQLATFGLSDAKYFLHWESDHPLVVRHVDGEPIYRLKEGRCESLADVRSAETSKV